VGVVIRGSGSRFVFPSQAGEDPGKNGISGIIVQNDRGADNEDVKPKVHVKASE
jgi:hypothetical protein